MTISLADQMACVRRELALRRAVYPGQVERRRITQAWADYQIAAMEAVLRTLEGLRDREPEERLYDKPGGV